MKSKLIEIKKLSTKFKEGKDYKVVHNELDLDVYDGEVLSIIGKNGCGKTTLVQTLVGLKKLQSGEINFADDFDLRNETGIQFQTEDKTSDLIRPKNLIKFFTKFYGAEKINEEKLNEMIEVFGLTEFMNRKLNKLSGGQRQRLNLLLAVMSQPRLIILDEFTTGLDISSVMGILEYIMKMKKENKATIIVITHQSKEIKMMADRVVHMRDGKIADEFTHKEIVEKYKNDFDDFLYKTIEGGK